MLEDIYNSVMHGKSETIESSNPILAKSIIAQRENVLFN